MQRSQAAFFNFVPNVAKVMIYATPPALEAIMPVCFLTDEQHQNYGCYAFAEEDPNHIGLTRFSVPLIPKPRILLAVLVAALAFAGWHFRAVIVSALAS